MKQNNWLRGTTVLTEYKVTSKGIRHIRTVTLGENPKDPPKPKNDEPKRDKPE